MAMLIYHNMSVSQSCLLSFLCNPFIYLSPVIFWNNHLLAYILLFVNKASLLALAKVLYCTCTDNSACIKSVASLIGSM